MRTPESGPNKVDRQDNQQRQAIDIPSGSSNRNSGYPKTAPPSVRRTTHWPIRGSLLRRSFESDDLRRRRILSERKPTGHEFRQNHRPRHSAIISSGRANRVITLKVRIANAEQTATNGLSDGRITARRFHGKICRASVAAIASTRHRTTNVRIRRFCFFIKSATIPSMHLVP
jgi:hypothetical protein